VVVKVLVNALLEDAEGDKRTVLRWILGREVVGKLRRT
jgi:hypothetical protein